MMWMMLCCRAAGCQGCSGLPLVLLVGHLARSPSSEASAKQIWKQLAPRSAVVPLCQGPKAQRCISHPSAPLPLGPWGAAAPPPPCQHQGTSTGGRKLKAPSGAQEGWCKYSW